MSQIILQEVESSQLHAIGHNPETNTLAIRFKNWKGEPTGLYHYSNFSAEDFAAFQSAESIGKHFGQHIKPETVKHPFVRIDGTPAAAPKKAEPAKLEMPAFALGKLQAYAAAHSARVTTGEQMKAGNQDARGQWDAICAAETEAARTLAYSILMYAEDQGLVPPGTVEVPA